MTRVCGVGVGWGDKGLWGWGEVTRVCGGGVEGSDMVLRDGGGGGGAMTRVCGGWG